MSDDAPALVDVDPFELPEWLGELDVVWYAGSGLRTAHLVVGALAAQQPGPAGRPAEPERLGCSLVAVDEAHPVPVADDATRVRAHRAWRHGQVLVVQAPDGDGIALAAPGTRWSSEGVLDALARLARAVGASPERYAVHLRIGDDPGAG